MGNQYSNILHSPFLDNSGKAADRPAVVIPAAMVLSLACDDFAAEAGARDIDFNRAKQAGSRQARADSALPFAECSNLQDLQDMGYETVQYSSYIFTVAASTVVEQSDAAAVRELLRSFSTQPWNI